VVCAYLSLPNTAYANVCDFQYHLQARRQRVVLQSELIDRSLGNDKVYSNLIL
jgi:hypothetical protein